MQKMRKENGFELDPEILSPMETLSFMLEVLRKASESINL